MTARDLEHATVGGADAPPHPRRDRLVAGGGLLLMAVLAGVGYGVAVGGSITPDDPARTVSDLQASAGLFRLGVVCLLGVVVLDVVVGWALYRVYRSVNPGIALLAAVVRFVYAAVFLVAVGQLALAADLLDPDLVAPAVGRDQVHLQGWLALGAFERIWNIGLGLFGVHLLLLGHLAHRSGFTPRVLGVLVALAGAGYTIDTLTGVLFAGDAPVVSVYLFAGELLLALWLLLSRPPGRVSATGG